MFLTELLVYLDLRAWCYLTMVYCIFTSSFYSVLVRTALYIKADMNYDGFLSLSRAPLRFQASATAVIWFERALCSL